MKDNGITLEVIRHGFKLSLLSAKVQQEVGYNLPEASSREIRDYYEEQKSTGYTTKPSRSVRLVVIGDKDKAAAVKAELASDDSSKAWEKIVAKHSKDPASQENLGLFENVTEEALERAKPLKEAVFTAPLKQVEGPLKTPAGYYVFEVVKSTPEEVQPLDEDLEDSISRSLAELAAKDAGPALALEEESIWKPRTFCAEGFIVEQCDNYVGRLSSASTVCNEERPQYVEAPDSCPPQVEATKPAMPGSVSLLEPHGEQRPQGPQQAGPEQELSEPPVYWPGAPPPESQTEGSRPSKEATAPKSQAKPKGAIAQVESGQIQFDLNTKGSKGIKVLAVLRGTLGKGTGAVVLGKGESRSTPDGKVSLSVVLTPAAKRALESQSQLPVTATMTVSAPGGKEETASQKITLLAE